MSDFYRLRRARRALRNRPFHANAYLSAGTVLAYPTGNLAVEVGTGGIVSWLGNNAIPLGIAVTACVVLFSTGDKNWAKIVNTVAVMLIGVALFAMSAPSTASAVGDWARGLIIKS
jgi:hypothetical protein